MPQSWLRPKPLKGSSVMSTAIAMGQPAFEPWMDAEAVAGQLEGYGIVISPKTLLSKASRRQLPSKKLNGRRRFRVSQLLAHFEGNDKRGG